MNAKVISIRRAFDPRARDAEARYDRVATRINQLSAARKRRRREAEELERQFVEDDLVARSGRRRGEPLTARGRRNRLRQLIRLDSELREIDDERMCLEDELNEMNRAIERWARETYGYGKDQSSGDVAHD